MPFHPQDEVQTHSLSDPESFWAEQAKHLSWHKKPSSTLSRTKKSLKSGTTHDHWEWFPDGEISTCYNCVDRHVEAGNGDQTAIIFDSPVTNTKEKITYKKLLEEVETFAGVLREEGVKKGDVVLMYSEYSPLSSYFILTNLSAYDTSCFNWNPRYLATWSNPCSRFRWIRRWIPCTTNRCLETSCNSHSFLRDRWG